MTLTATDKLGKPVTYTYDESGRELTRTNRNGEVLTRTYDAAGRLETMSGTGVDRTLANDARGSRTARSLCRGFRRRAACAARRLSDSR